MSHNLRNLDYGHFMVEILPTVLLKVSDNDDLATVINLGILRRTSILDN